MLLPPTFARSLRLALTQRRPFLPSYSSSTLPNMLTALDAPPNAFDEQELSFVTSIRENGWFRTNVFEEADSVGFSYTTGFWVNAQQPELITFSMRSETAHDVFWDLFRDGRAGRHLAVGRRTDNVFANVPAYAFTVAQAHYQEHLGWSRWFYAGDYFPCVQIVWSDRSGLFPWESGFDPALLNSQPDLTEKGWLASLAD